MLFCQDNSSQFDSIQWEQENSCDLRFGKDVNSEQQQL